MIINHNLRKKILSNENYLKIKLFLNYKVPASYMNIRHDDVFLVSYPKSGNTWLRFIIGNLFSDKRVDFNNFNLVIPDIYTSYKHDVEKLSSPRIIKSHEPYTKLYPKVIYIYRDPRDVSVSYYFWMKKYRSDFNQTIDTFIKSFIDGSSLPYGRWDEHIDKWMNSPLAINNKILLLEYESLKKDPFCSVKKISDFLNLSVTEEKIKDSIKLSDFEHMKKLEKTQQKTSNYLKKSDKSIKFVRSGKSEWRDYFTNDLKNKFKSKFGKTLIELGYESDFNW